MRSLDGLLALAKIFNNSAAVESLSDGHDDNIADRLNAALARVDECDPREALFEEASRRSCSPQEMKRARHNSLALTVR
jgi:hypothetical protein